MLQKKFNNVSILCVEEDILININRNNIHSKGAYVSAFCKRQLGNQVIRQH